MGYYDQEDNPPPRRGGFNGRLIAAIIMALVGVFMYLSQVEENPVTGKRQHVSMSPDQEIRLGLASAPEMTRQMGGEIPSSDPRAREVSRIGELILKSTIAQKSPWKFHFHLLADPSTINAFALPGGQVFITLGLYNKLQTEAQLAGVLSHEMGHVIERHSAQQMAKSNLGQIFVTAVATGTSSDDSSAMYSNPAIIASVVNQMIQLRYGRKDESQSDLWGVQLMRQAGFTPKAMIEVLQILKAASGPSGQPEIFLTHPDPDNRIKQIEAYLVEHPPEPDLTEGKRLVK